MASGCIALAALVCSVLQAMAATDCSSTKKVPGNMPKPQGGFDLPLIASLMFIFAVGITVGCDVTFGDLIRTARTQPRAFAAGVCCQFGIMPFIGFLFSLVLPADDAWCNKSSVALAVQLPGCMPGGTTSNLLTLLVGGNVELSILMSLFSNICAIFMIPLLLFVYYESQYGDDATAVKVPYMSIVLPLFLMLVGLTVGILVKALANDTVVTWTRRLGGAFAILFLTFNTILGFVLWLQDPIPTVPFVTTGLSYQPLGYTLGFLLAKFVFRINLRDALTVSIETGVQNWALPLAIALFAFDIEEDDRVIADLLFNGAYGPMLTYTLHCSVMILMFRWITKTYDPSPERATKDDVHEQTTEPTTLSSKPKDNENTPAKDAQAMV